MMPAAVAPAKIVLLIALRYTIVAGIFWLIWYVLIRKKVAHRKIQLKYPKLTDYRREIAFSAMTVLIFAAFPVLLLQTPLRRFTQFYTDIHAHSIMYFWLAFPLNFIVHDAYFYWMHRLMHHPRVFRSVHLVHHRSTNPTPWAAMAFHPLEAVVEGGAFAFLLVIMPMSIWHVVLFFLVMMVYNVYGHLGWELYPKGFSKHRLGKWINTSVSHNQHHQFFKGNYGLYFLWWDRWMGTLRNDYDQHFDALKSRVNEKAQSAL